MFIISLFSTSIAFNHVNALKSNFIAPEVKPSAGIYRITWNVYKLLLPGWKMVSFIMQLIKVHFRNMAIKSNIKVNTDFFKLLVCS